MYGFNAQSQEGKANAELRSRVRAITSQDLSLAANELAAIRALASSRVMVLVRKVTRYGNIS